MSFFKAAKAMSELSDFDRAHIGCVVTIGSHRIISSGYNSTKSHPLQKQLNKERFNADSGHSLHAEVAALLPLMKEDIDFSKVSLYVYRKKRNGELGLARPCASCILLIKKLKIRNIYYTNEGGYSYEKIVY